LLFFLLSAIYRFSSSHKYPSHILLLKLLY